ncbi:taste receptor type 2 member 39 [Marmota flaviventris]|uniref:taste receptor type 2 member 39 n=1 Tax=Marmota flaviventris TaxID=93162 RepID=UPI000FFFA055|nr:taste receptor type 2 member 39 [Marmota flaviventris]
MLRRRFLPDSREEQQLRMAEPCNSPENELSLFAFILIFTIIGAECMIGIIANGFIMAINAAAWVQKKAVSTNGRILLFLSVSRIALQSFMMLEVILSDTSPIFLNKDVLYDSFKVSFMFLNYCSLWFAAWLSFFYFVKIANFSHPLFLKLKWRISGWIPWLLWLSLFISFISSMLFCKDIYPVYCNNSFTVPFSNSTKKVYFTETNVLNLAFFFNLGILIPLIIFIVTATLLIVSLKRHTLHMKNCATGSRDPSMEAHMGAIKATSYFLILYIFNAVSLFLYVSNIFDASSPWNILFKIIMAVYPAGHSMLLIQDNPGLRRAWKQLCSQIHLYPKEKILRSSPKEEHRT